MAGEATDRPTPDGLAYVDALIDAGHDADEVRRQERWAVRPMALALARIDRRACEALAAEMGHLHAQYGDMSYGIAEAYLREALARDTDD